MRYAHLALLLPAVVFPFKSRNLGTVSVQLLSASLALPLSLPLRVCMPSTLTGGVDRSLLGNWVYGATTKPPARG